MVPGLILMTLTYGFGEFIAPSSDVYAREYRAFIQNRTMSVRGSSTGAWVREVTQSPTGERSVRYINVQKITSDQEAQIWRVYDFNSKQNLTRIVTADSGTWAHKQGWLLKQAVNTSLPILSYGFSSCQYDVKNEH